MSTIRLLTRSGAFGVSLLALLLCAVPVAAGDDFKDVYDDSDSRTVHRFEIGLRTAYRIDELSTNDYSPTGGVRVLYYPSEWVAFTFGMTYNSHARLSDQASSKSLVSDFTLRVMTNDERLTPFIELGQATTRYWVLSNNYRRSVTNLGFRVGAGLSYKLGRRYAVDLVVSQLLNHRNEVIYYEILAPQSPAPCPEGVDCGTYSDIPNDTYNEANVELMFRFGL